MSDRFCSNINVDPLYVVCCFVLNKIFDDKGKSL